MMDMESIRKLTNILIFESTPIVCENGKGNIVSTNNIIESKGCNLFFSNLGERNDLNPLHEIFCSCNDEFVAIGSGRVNIAYEIKSPLEKGPWSGSRLQLLCWCMNKASMNLTLLTLFEKLI